MARLYPPEIPRTSGFGRPWLCAVCSGASKKNNNAAPEGFPAMADLACEVWGELP
eukprot:CAMPEP_0115505720 /NCGR_PEP_ID=MMETSP0271-20121206/70743_1 /TAXON_ID=71861 /ORGANISM="Scrippsiella trochoidea, Strain CCMP3099" /LENGTH=54 /DNA_ID=CAMNT_0002935063 /DNA_START=18 /DNA_END=180 /DNA_ORIENTATION=+